MAERRRFALDSAVLAITNGSSAVLSAIYVSVGGRILGPAEYSTVTSLLSLVYLYSLLLGPIETGITKFAARYHGEGARDKLAALTFGSLRWLRKPLALGLIVWCPLIPAIRRALHIDGFAGLVWLTVFAVGWLICSIPRGTLRGDHRFVAYGVNQIIEAATRLVVGIAAVAVGGRAGSVIAGYAAGVAVATLVALFQLRDLRETPGTDFDRREIFAFSLPLLLFYFYFLSIGNIDMLVAKRTLPDFEAGWYGAASTLARMLFLGAAPIYLVLFSRVAARKDDESARGRLTVTVLVAMAAALAVGYVVIWFAGDRIIQLMFGAKFAGAAPIVRITWITMSLLVLQAVAAFALLGQDQTRGSSLFIVPVVALVGLLAWRHQTAMEVAFCSLASVCIGALVVGVLFALGRGQPARRQTVVAQNVQL